MDSQLLVALLNNIGFSLADGSGYVWEKIYRTHSDFAIEVVISPGNYRNSIVKYGDRIKADRDTTKNFSQPESIVVLECVNRLLEQGYPPERIRLEKKYPIATSDAYLDIQIVKDGKTFLMIECKESIKKFNKEKNKMIENGGQLIGYYQQDKSAQYLCLYTSELNQNPPKPYIALVETSALEGETKEEIVVNWDKEFFDNGIFESHVKPFVIEEKKLRKSDLIEITKDDASKIFNQFEEILRRHSVSDKPNAFNKIFNLFIAKIEDEEKNDDEILDFQWQAGERHADVLHRIESLYRRGLKNFLNIHIEDNEISEIENHLLSLSSAKKSEIYNIIKKYRTFSNNDFAFREVYNEATYIENTAIVRDIIRLLQVYQLRYTTKQQFLGEFFEKLLNTSMKQEAGQFFTPIPLARFIVSSLPLESMIEKKISAGDNNFIPYAIDYASGSGHFLTEYMSEIDSIIQSIDPKKLRASQKSNLSGWKISYKWAETFVYGIEKDYRLAKTTKVSCFLNGDGEAKIICADGLDSFFHSKSYLGILKLESKNVNNEVFDILIANPPYSVDRFKSNLAYGKESFELYNQSTADSGEIEAFFIERAKQLIREGGKVGIILPSSLLSNGGLSYKAKEIIISYFKFISIVQLSSNAFMATGTNTSILFLERRSNLDIVKAKDLVNQFFKDGSSGNIFGVSNPIGEYVREFWGLSIEEYLNGINAEDYSKIKSSIIEEYSDYAINKKGEIDYKKLREVIDSNERSKIFTYLMAKNQRVLTAISPKEKDEEQRFLGYRFTKRRTIEGMELIKYDNDKIKSSLYSEDDPRDHDKLNFYIREMFLGREITPMSGEISRIASYHDLIDLINFNDPIFDMQISMRPISSLSTIWPTFRLGKICNIKIGGTPSRRNRRDYFEGGSHNWVAISDLKQKYVCSTKEKLTDAGVKNSNVKLIPKDTVLFSFKLTIGKIAITSCELYTNEAIAALEIKSEFKDKLDSEYLYNIFDLYGSTLLSATQNGEKKFGRSLNIKTLKRLQIPLPPTEDQAKFLHALNSIRLAQSDPKKLATELQDAANGFILGNVKY